MAGDDGPTGEIAISGAISGEVQEWVRTALDAPLAQGYGLTRASRRGIEWSQMDELVSGYGLTETTGGTTVQKYNDLSIGIAGTPMATMEAALPLPAHPERGRAPRLTRD